MRPVIEAGLFVALCAAVLAFGGTAPQFFAITQGIVLILGILLLVVRRPSAAPSIHLPVTVPLILVALVFFQILPLPASLARALKIPGNRLPGQSYFTISVAPYQTMSHLLLLVTYLTAFYLVLILCERRTAKKRIVYALLAIGIFEAFYGLIQYLTGWQQIFTYVKKFYLQDATGTYINRNHFAGLLEMTLPFAVALALRQVWALRQISSEGRSRIKKILSRPEFFFFVFWLFVAATLFAALVFSRSRMGIISSLSSMIAMLALAGASSWSTKTRLAVGVVFLIGVSALAFWIGTDPAITRFETLGQQYSRPGEDRISIWRDTLKLIHRHPILGTGFGTFAIAYPSVQTAFLTLLVDHAHCDYLEFATELGLPTAVLLFGSIFWIMGLTVGSCRQPGEGFDKAISLACLGSISAVLLHSLTDFNLYIPANALLFVILLALAWSNVSRVEERTAPASDSRTIHAESL